MLLQEKNSTDVDSTHSKEIFFSNSTQDVNINIPIEYSWEMSVCMEMLMRPVVASQNASRYCGLIAVVICWRRA